MRGEAALGFDGGEVLHVVAEVAAQVLDEPVEQRGERQRVPRRPVIVIGCRVGGRAVLVDPAVGRAGQGDEQGRAEGLAVRRGVGLAHRARADLAAGQVRGVLAAAGRAVPPRGLVRGRLAAHACVGDLLVQLGKELVQVGGVLPGGGGLVAEFLGFGAFLDPPLLILRRRVRGDGGFVLEVPAFPALRRAQRPGPLGAGRGRRAPGCARRGRAPVSISPVSRLVRRSWIGRMQAPCSTARSLTTWRASGMAIRCARVDRAVVSVTGHLRSAWSPVQVSDQPHRRHSYRGGEVPSSSRIRPVAQTGHGSSVRQAVGVVTLPPTRPARAGTGPPSRGCRRR